MLVNLKALAMLRRMAEGKLQQIGGYPYTPQKTDLLHREKPLRPLPRSTPQAEGVCAQTVENFLRELNHQRVHAAMVVRHGRVITEACWRPYRPDYAHMTYSLSKSVTCMAVGLAVADGLLSTDEKVVDIFKDRLPRLRPPRINHVTVEHLLTMTSGIHFNEAGSILEKDWVRCVLEGDCAFAPGARFFYNSMNSYLLSAIVCKRTGKTLTEYLTPRLFAPLGIEPYWETCPMGTEKGGWGLWLTLEDMAKLGQLFLNGGRWPVDGASHSLIPAGWVSLARTEKVRTSTGNCKHGYGYQIWMCPFEDAYQFNGAFGQYVLVCPRQDMVIALQSHARNMFSTGAVTDIVAKYFDAPQNLSDTPRSPAPQKQRRLSRTIKNLTIRPGSAASLHGGELRRVLSPPGLYRSARDERRYHGAAFKFEPNICSALPVALQCVHNNFTAGISHIDFAFEPETVTVTFTEGKDTVRITAGLDGRHRYGPVSLRGEPYMTGSIAKWTFDELERSKLLIFCAYIETPHIRIFSFLFDGDNVTLKCTEWPTAYEASAMLIELLGESERMGYHLLSGAAETAVVKSRVERFCEPSATGKRLPQTHITFSKGAPL